MADTGRKRIRALLVADTPLAAVVDTRVQTPRFKVVPTLPAVWFTMEGGETHGQMPLRQPTVETHSLGSTEDQAWQVHELLRTAFLGDLTQEPTVQAAVLRGQQILTVIEEQEGQDDIDKFGEHGTPSVIGFFSVVFVDD